MTRILRFKLSSTTPLKLSYLSRHGIFYSHVFLYNPGAATSLDQLYMRILHVDALVVAPILVLFPFPPKEDQKVKGFFV